MNTSVAIRKCRKYEVHDIYSIIAEIYEITNGPEVEGKKVLVKPDVQQMMILPGVSALILL